MPFEYLNVWNVFLSVIAMGNGAAWTEIRAYLDIADKKLSKFELSAIQDLNAEYAGVMYG